MLKKQNYEQVHVHDLSLWNESRNANSPESDERSKSKNRIDGTKSPNYPQEFHAKAISMLNKRFADCQHAGVTLKNHEIVFVRRGRKPFQWKHDEEVHSSGKTLRHKSIACGSQRGSRSFKNDATGFSMQEKKVKLSRITQYKPNTNGESNDTTKSGRPENPFGGASFKNEYHKPRKISPGLKSGKHNVIKSGSLEDFTGVQCSSPYFGEKFESPMLGPGQAAVDNDRGRLSNPEKSRFSSVYLQDDTNDLVTTGLSSRDEISEIEANYELKKWRQVQQPQSQINKGRNEPKNSMSKNKDPISNKQFKRSDDGKKQ